jgi:polysaccharide pyruvyl transferase WcaK-like protein
LSVGVCSLDSKLGSLFAQRALKLADYRSYRDVGSKELLADMKFTHADEVVPDLAFSYAANSTTSHDVATGGREGLRIGISPIAYLQKDHWPRTDAAVFGRYAESLAYFIGALLGRGHEVVLFATDAPDREVTKLLMSDLERHCSHDRRMKLRAAQVDCVSELLMELARLDCVVASRLHGVILSHLCAKPVLAISYDRKVKHYMEDMEQSMHCLDIHSVRAEELEKALDQLWLRQDVAKTTIKRKARVYRQKLAAQYEELARSIQPVVLQPQQPDVIAS